MDTISGDVTMNGPALINGFIQARHYNATAMRKIDLICLHTMEAPEKPNTAHGVAGWFAGPSAPEASCTYAIDMSEIWQCVRDGDVAWGAPGTNHNGLHFEHAGYASQNDAQWHDKASLAILDKSARLAAMKCVQYDIPIAFVDAGDLLEGERGITTHREVTRACQLANSRGLKTSPFYNKKNPAVPLTTHSDPGVAFPMLEYLAAVRKYAVPIS